MSSLGTIKMLARLLSLFLISSHLLKFSDEQFTEQYQIAFISEVGNSGRHMVMVNENGNKDRKFPSPDLPGRYFNGVTTTNDGKRVAFMRDVEGIDRYSLWVMDYDGTNLKRLTKVGKEALYPSWSGDGSKLAFSRRDGGVWEIYTIRADGSEERRISNFRMEGKRPSWGATTSWSADGRTIAYSIRFGRDDDYEIYLMDVDGANLRQLTDNDHEDRNPDFSHDGNRIAFNTTKNGVRETAIMDLQTREIKYLGNKASTFRLSWSPDGKKIAYSGIEGRNHDIYVMNSDGTDQRRLTTSGGLDIDPTWIYIK